MRIIQYIPEFTIGGTHKAGCVLGETLSAMGHNVMIVADQGGPRYKENSNNNLNYKILDNNIFDSLPGVINDFSPDIVHMHLPFYDKKRICMLSDSFHNHAPLLVTTPVFGRPPSDLSLIKRTKTCCVGLYTFYRLCRWLKLDFEQAIRQGIFYAPLTPFEPPSNHDLANGNNNFRHELGVPASSIIIGRIGRDAFSKWHRDHQYMIDALLNQHPNVTWLSVGYPKDRGLESLKRKWGFRFINFPETPDYLFLCKVFSSLDVQLFYSTYGECFSSTICEAAGNGIPTVAICNPFRDNGQSEQIIDGVTGILTGCPKDALKSIGRLIYKPTELHDLKISSKNHAYSRWHMKRVAADIQEMYNYFFNGGSIAPDYLEVMADEYAHFSPNYRPRIAKIMSSNFLSYASWLTLISATESWDMFRLGRNIKNIYDKVYK